MDRNNAVLYAFSKEDLERIVENVIDKIRRTELNSETNQIPEEDCLTQKEAAALFRVSVQSLIKWKKKGIIPFYQIEGSIMYSKKELLNLAKNRPELVKAPKD
jgi:DNA-binding transcriptional regulator YiaG